MKLEKLPSITNMKTKFNWKITFNCKPNWVKISWCLEWREKQVVLIFCLNLDITWSIGHIMGWSSLASNTDYHHHFVWMWTSASHCASNLDNQPENDWNPENYRLPLEKTESTETSKMKCYSRKNEQEFSVDYQTCSGSRTRRQKVSTGPTDGSRGYFLKGSSLVHETPGLGPKYCSLDFKELANQAFSLCCIMSCQKGKVLEH